MWEDFLRQLKQLPDAVWNVVLAAAAILTGFLFKGIATLILRLYSKTNLSYSLFRTILTHINRPFTFFLPLLTFNLVLPFMQLNKGQYSIINKITGILLI